ncbi:hypothetical protein MKW98_023067 [Papaver atlanticum]|uniref:Uncharacterized protein n=1 Tax=Papaver atlanticum TaxID=357466 RepID=A0AAD4TAY4_9MAGN|nr:hypothetical protein MKW98_023067 [Papaver atlanticum]
MHVNLVGDEEELAVVPMVEKVLEESQAGVLQEGNCLKVVQSKKGRRPVKKFVIKYDVEDLSRRRWMPLPLITQRPCTMKLSTTRFPIYQETVWRENEGISCFSGTDGVLFYISLDCWWSHRLPLNLISTNQKTSPC